MRTSKFRSCPLCEAICGLDFQFEDAKLVAIRGDSQDPFSRGHICPKGNAILDLEADPDRLRTPMRRVGDKWVQTTWEEAFTLVGESIARIQNQHGLNSVGVYLGNPTVHHFGHFAYLPFLLRAVRTQNLYTAGSVDQWPHEMTNWHMYGHPYLAPIPDIDHTDYFLMLGANPIASNGSLMTAPDVKKRIQALTQRGKLIVIDPRRTETAELASEHHFIKPAGDVYFLIAFLQALIKVGPARLHRYEHKIAGWDDAIASLANFRFSSLVELTGISEQSVYGMAQEFYLADSAVAYGRVGVSVQKHGTLCQWLLQLINIYTGNLDKPGGCLLNEPALPLTGPSTRKPKSGRWRSRVRGFPEFHGGLPAVALREEIEIPGEGQIRALFTVAANPVLSIPHGNALSKALESLEFMVCMDFYINETTRHAHVILPPASFLTQDHYDIALNAFAIRRIAKLSQPLLPLESSERGDWEIIDGVCKAISEAKGEPWQSLPPPKQLIAQGLSAGNSGLSIQDLEKAEHGVDLGPLRPSLMTRLETESGNIETAPALFMKALAKLPRTIEATDQNVLLLIGRRHLLSNNSWMHNAQRLVKGKPRHQLFMNPRDMEARGISDGSLVRVRSKTGVVVVEVLQTQDIMLGVVSLPHGFGHQVAGVRMKQAQAVPGASYNDLTSSDVFDAPSGTAAFNATEVWVELERAISP